MIITDLLGARVFGPDFLGFVSDVRFRFDTDSLGQPAWLYGIIVSPHARSSSLGFERFRCAVALADRSTGALATPRLLSSSVGGYRADRRQADPAQRGIRARLAGAALIISLGKNERRAYVARKDDRRCD